MVSSLFYLAQGVSGFSVPPNPLSLTTNTHHGIIDGM